MYELGDKLPSDGFSTDASWAVHPNFYYAPTPEEGPEPKPYQYAGVEYVLARKHAIIGDAPGTGKTAECVMVSNAIEAKRTLVICPASLRLNWQREIWMWSITENVSTYPVLKSSDGISDVHNYTIMSYDLLRSNSILNAVLGINWDHLILDEAHYLKDPKGNKRTKAICAPDMLPSVVGRITLATGTPMPNQPIEIYNAVRLCNWDAIGRVSLEGFREYYYAEGDGWIYGPEYDKKLNATVYRKHRGRVRNKPRRLRDLQRRLRENVMVRRLKEQVLPQLPPKQWHPFPIIADSKIRQALKHPGWEMAEKLYDLDQNAFSCGIPIDGAISTARRLLGEAKASTCADYVIDLLNSGVNAVIVSAFHRAVFQILYERLHKYGLVYMEASMSNAKRQAAVDTFQNDDRKRIMLGQTSILMLGWTLSRAQDVVITEPDWVPGNNDQLLDRVHRLGQTGNYVLGHVPVVPGTMDERVLGTAIDKAKHIYTALDKR